MKSIRKMLAILLSVLLLTGCTLPTLPEAPTVASPTGDGLEIHFIDVGQADCALLKCDGAYVLIDGGNVDDSSLVVSYLEKEGVQDLAAVFCSHAHEDHVGGLPGVLAVYPTSAVYAPTRTYASRCFDDFVYYTDQQGLTVTIPKPGDTLTFGDATIEVLGPVKTYAETNDTSLVLMVNYGSTRFLFTGDMETTAEADLMDSGADLRADVLKVGHHGSNTSSGYRFLYEVAPRYAVISVGTDNTYGHPHDEPLSRLNHADATVYRTDLLGTVIARSNGADITFSWQKNAQPDIPDTGITTYIGNKNSKVFHGDTCENLPKEKNQVLFESYKEAVREGYTPCGQCLG